MLHVLIEATQFIFNRGRSLYTFGDNRIDAQYDKQVPERCAQVTAFPAYRSRTITLRQMVFEKPPDYFLVEAKGIQMALAHPARKVGNATEIGINGVG